MDGHADFTRRRGPRRGHTGTFRLCPTLWRVLEAPGPNGEHYRCMAQLNWTYEEVVLAGDLVAANDWKGLRKDDPRVAELSSLLRAATIYPLEGRSDNFRSVNGIARKTYDIATLHPDYEGEATKGGKHDKMVLREYMMDERRMHALAEGIRASLLNEASAALNNPEIEVLSAQEGTAYAVTHLRRERDPKLRRAKIETVLTARKKLECEVCAFDFARVYGELGEGYIEVHYVRPLHDSGPVTTRLEDLALLCSNCHRMVHRARPWITPVELAERVMH